MRAGTPHAIKWLVDGGEDDRDWHYGQGSRDDIVTLAFESNDANAARIVGATTLVPTAGLVVAVGFMPVVGLVRTAAFACVCRFRSAFTNVRNHAAHAQRRNGEEPRRAYRNHQCSEHHGEVYAYPLGTVNVAAVTAK